MNVIEILLGLVIGLLLAAAFFGGLWLTSLKALHSNHPLLWMMVSRVIRFGIVLGVIFVWMDGQSNRAIACLVGFVLGRTLIMRYSVRGDAFETRASSKVV